MTCCPDACSHPACTRNPDRCLLGTSVLIAVRTLREELRWLGNFTLPFVTLYRSSEVKGVFKLSMPPAILGYSKDKRSESKRLVPDSALQLFVTVRPLCSTCKKACETLLLRPWTALDYAGGSTTSPAKGTNVIDRQRYADLSACIKMDPGGAELTPCLGQAASSCCFRTKQRGRSCVTLPFHISHLASGLCPQKVPAESTHGGHRPS
jgi:hypothetical protein